VCLDRLAVHRERVFVGRDPRGFVTGGRQCLGRLVPPFSLRQVVRQHGQVFGRYISLRTPDGRGDPTV
jgi:hypothetical protein